MSSWKCLVRAETPRGTARLCFPALALLVCLLPGGAPAQQGRAPILPPDAAARSFVAGRDAVRRGDYRLAVVRLEEALATGHTKPEERFGTTRNFVDRYDPDYWLGVAYMELGVRDKARAHLERSRANGAIVRWPEGSDLSTRLAALQERPAQSQEEPTRTPEEPPPAPIPTAAVTPTARPIPIPPNPAPTPVPLDPAPFGGVTTSAVSPASAAKVPAAEFAPLLDALGRADWRSFDRDLLRLRARAPEALEPSLLEAVGCGTRYLLDGRKDAALLARARRSLADYRRRGGSKRTERLLVSPALDALL